MRHWSVNWCPGYLEHAIFRSEIHLAAANSSLQRQVFAFSLLEDAPEMTHKF